MRQKHYSVQATCGPHIPSILKEEREKILNDKWVCEMGWVLWKRLDPRIERSYYFLRMLYKIPIPYHEFHQYVYGHSKIQYQGYVLKMYGCGRYRKPGFWYDYHGCDFHKKISFVQHGILPKENPVSDQYEVNRHEAKKEWRKKKARDGRRRHPGKNGRASAHRTFALWQMSKEERMRAKKLIKNGRYDKLPSKRDPMDWWRID